MIYRHQVLKQADVVLAMFAAQRPVLARAEAPQLRLLRPDHDRRLVAVGVRAGDGGGRRSATTSSPSTTSARRCSSTSPTPTATPATACTSPRPAGCGARSCSASPGCSTTGRRCASRRACRRAWEGVSFRMQRHGSRMSVELDADGLHRHRARRPAGADRAGRGRVLHRRAGRAGVVDPHPSAGHAPALIGRAAARRSLRRPVRVGRGPCLRWPEDHDAGGWR